MNDHSASLPASETIELDRLSDHQNTPLKLGSRKAKNKTEGWNVFHDSLPNAASFSETNHRCMQALVKIIKIIISLTLFIVILGSSVIAKLTILFMTSQLKEGRTILLCNHLTGPEKTFVVTLPEEERIVWTWCIIFAFLTPEIRIFIRDLITCLLKSVKRPKIHHFMLVVVMQTFHVVGLAIMFMNVLPELNVVQGAMLTNCVCFVPGLFGLLSRKTNCNEGKRIVLLLVDIAALAAQATAFIVWPLLDSSNKSLWLNPIALFLVSCGWWENYVSIHSPFSGIRSLGRIKEELTSTKQFTTVFVSLWKMITFLCSSVIILHLKGNNVTHVFTMFGTAFGDHNITAYEVQSIVDVRTTPDLTTVLPDGMTLIMTTDSSAPASMLQTQITSASLTYIFGILACKFMVQRFSYALPINLTMPVTISLLIAACALRDRDPCFFHGKLPDYVFYESPTASGLSDFISEEYAWVWLLWLLSQTWITLHIWTPKCEHLASIAKLFISPALNGLLVDQSVALNRRLDDQSETTAEIDNDPETQISIIKTKDRDTKIFACATMWHETNDEMLTLLKCILKMDLDHWARKFVQDVLEILDPDYYEFETHIFFDDAFEICDSQVNHYVKRFIDVLDEAVTEIHHTWIHIQAPKKYPTPYGGRLVWTLPGNTKMVVHLKDNSKIRHRKRWSQVMYMYYLLGHRIMDLPISDSRKEIISENTFLLTLDGDVNFEPSAVKRLVNLMKKDAKVGAACGRIHPVGSGPMVWYQMFEYAIGHWFQKATEHIIGCVLWSPGCFSLFRAKALMDDSVIKRYTFSSNTARQYVQREYGEDRWLSILLLQKGYKIDYSDASHASIHPPKNFQEFFNQRRRWIPSTIANVMDLIMNCGLTVKNNDSISRTYILYLVLLMVSTILGPGIVFLGLVECFVSAFDFTLWTSFYLNIIPVSLFILVCYTCKSSTQLHVAAVISIMYMLTMMVALTTIVITTTENGWLSPSSLIFFSIIGLVTIAGIMHPQELICLLGGFTYYLTIPTMYLLLVIHSVINLNGPSRETRKERAKKTFTQLLEEKEEVEEAKVMATRKVPGGDHRNENNKVQTIIEFSLALFSCTLYNHRKTSDIEHQLVPIADSSDHMMKPSGATDGRDSHETSVSPVEGLDPERDRYSVSPHWLGDEDFEGLEVDFLSRQEERFWKDLINEYLTPLEKNETEKEQIANDLKELRNNNSFVFLILNALLITMVFLMQLNKDTLSIRWPFGSSTNGAYDASSLEVHITGKYFQLEPIGLVFVIVFIPILAIQFIAMLIHRLGIFFRILASTDLHDWLCFKGPEDLANDSTLQSKDAIAIVKELQRLNDEDDDYDSTNLDGIFRDRFFSGEELGLSRNLPTGISRKTLKAFETRRTIVIDESIKSRVETEQTIGIGIKEGDEYDNKSAQNLMFEIEHRVTLNSNSTESCRI